VTNEDVARAVMAVISAPDEDRGGGCALATASLAAVVLQTADQALMEAVTTARRRGHSWGEIGAALGVSRQAAWARFSDTTGIKKGRQSCDEVQASCGQRDGHGPCQCRGTTAGNGEHGCHHHKHEVGSEHKEGDAS
jgi:hypothetical protein